MHITNRYLQHLIEKMLTNCHLALLEKTTISSPKSLVAGSPATLITEWSVMAFNDIPPDIHLHSFGAI